MSRVTSLIDLRQHLHELALDRSNRVALWRFSGDEARRVAREVRPVVELGEPWFTRIAEDTDPRVYYAVVVTRDAVPCEWIIVDARGVSAELGAFPGFAKESEPASPSPSPATLRTAGIAYEEGRVRGERARKGKLT